MYGQQGMDQYGGGMGMNQGMALQQGMQMQQMGMMNALSGNPNYFFFAGTSLSLQSRLESMSDEEVNRIVDANITVTGVQIQ